MSKASFVPILQKIDSCRSYFMQVPKLLECRGRLEMSVTIHWVNQQKQANNCAKVVVPFGSLLVYQCDNVIIQTQWCVIGLDELVVDSYLGTQIQRYLNNPTSSLVVSLQKQGTDFRHKVWAEICKIPVGQVLSYSKLANQVGSGARAVANACRDNPFPGIIPCHRVVAENGLGGYMGETSGTLFEVKRHLLLMESQAIKG